MAVAGEEIVLVSDFGDGPRGAPQTTGSTTDYGSGNEPCRGVVCFFRRGFMSSLKFVCVAAALSVAAVTMSFACSSTPGTEDDGDGGSGPGATDPVVSASECGSQCEQKAAECGAPAGSATSQCDAICGRSPTKSQVACLLEKSCSVLARLDSADDFDEACAKPSTPPAPTSGRDSSVAPRDSGPTACVAIGKTGCSSLNAPSGCCADSKRPTIVCNGNNDGKGNAQCCVNQGKTCVEVSDCCGYAGASDDIKKLYRCDGTCKF